MSHQTGPEYPQESKEPQFHWITGSSVNLCHYAVIFISAASSVMNQGGSISLSARSQCYKTQLMPNKNVLNYTYTCLKKSCQPNPCFKLPWFSCCVCSSQVLFSLCNTSADQPLPSVTVSEPSFDVYMENKQLCISTNTKKEYYSTRRTHLNGYSQETGSLELVIWLRNVE